MSRDDAGLKGAGAGYLVLVVLLVAPFLDSPWCSSCSLTGFPISEDLGPPNLPIVRCRKSGWLSGVEDMYYVRVVQFQISEVRNSRSLNVQQIERCYTMAEYCKHIPVHRGAQSSPLALYPKLVAIHLFPELQRETPQGYHTDHRPHTFITSSTCPSFLLLLPLRLLGHILGLLMNLPLHLLRLIRLLDHILG